MGGTFPAATQFTVAAAGKAVGRLADVEVEVDAALGTNDFIRYWAANEL